MNQTAFPARSTRLISPGLLLLFLVVIAVLLVNGMPWVSRLFGQDAAANRASVLPAQTELLHTTVQKPEESKTGTCEAHSTFAPRADAWRCEVEGGVFDPCFETSSAPALNTAGTLVAGEPGVVVCGAEPLSGATGFYVRGALPPARTVASGTGIDPTTLESLSYLIDVVGKPVTLTRGQYYLPWVEQTKGSLLVGLSELRAHGDLDSDGDEDLVVLLVADAADDRMLIYLGAVRNDAGTGRAESSLLLGDRVKVDNLEIRNGQIVVAMTTHTPDDPACCPTMDVEYHYVLESGRLRQVVDGWRLELAGGIQCVPVQAQPQSRDPRFAYQCSDGTWLRSGLTPGRLWSATRAGGVPVTSAQPQETISPAPTTSSSQIPVVRVWQ